MSSPAIRCFTAALAAVVLAACHGSGGDAAAPVDTVAPSVPAGVTAAATSATAIAVTWNASTDSGGAGLKDYVVYRGGAAIAFITSTNFADSGLTASTIYSYQIAARDNANNESGRSAVISATTLAHPDTTPPSVPTGLTAAATSATTVDVNWNAATDPGGSGVKDYTVYRGGIAVATVATTSFVDSGLAANTLYSYEVSARDNTDNVSKRSSVVTATTLATPDTTPPSVPAGLTATATSATTVSLSWGAATDTGGSGLKDYTVYRDGLAVASVATTSFVDSGLTASTLYAYEVSARDNALNASARSAARNVTTPATSDTTPPSVPGTLTASATSSTQVDLTWGAATDNVGVVGYRVERCSGVGCTSFAQVATPTGTSFSDTGLAASTSYSYRVRAADLAGNTGPFSNTGSATTQAAADTTPPSAPGALTASAVSSTQIDLSWSAATDNVGVAGYRLERCVGAGCNSFAQFATPTGTSFSDTGLTPATSYSYRVRAIDAASNPGPFSNSSSATTHAPPDLTPPSAPATLISSAVSAAQIDLSWGAATDDVGVTGYRIERCSGAGCSSFAQIATPTGTSFNDIGLTASTSYSYRVRALDAAGNLSAFSNTTSVATQAAPDTTPPGAPGMLTSSASSSTQINLSWIAATDNVGVTGYLVERCSGAGCTTFAPIATPAGTSFDDTGLTASTSYSYRVRAVDAAGNAGGFSDTSTALTQAVPDTTPPSVPGTLTSSAVSATQIDLSWGPATDNVGVTGYRVERCSGLGCSNFAQFATPTGTSYSDTGLAPSTSYSYRVRAVDAANNLGVYSNTSGATTQAAPDVTPPSAPGTLTSNAVSPTQIDLSWGAAADDVGVTGYRVERCSGAACSSFVAVATSTETTFSDTGLTAATSYSYRVRAVDAANNLGVYSNSSSATTQAARDTTPPSAPGTLTSNAISPTEVNLTWNAATDDVGVTGYWVERCAGASCSDFAQIATPIGTSFSDTGLTASTSYSYRVRAVDAAGNSGPFSNTSSAATPDTTPPSAPGTLTSSAISSTQIDLSWGAATDDVGVTGYRVERCTGAGCASFVQIATPTGTTFGDTGRTASTPYSYRVRAVDAAGNPGPYSNISSATTPDTTPPSAPGALTSSAISATEIDLSWSAATDDVGVTGYRVERCGGAACVNFAQIATPAGTSLRDTGLTASTSYSYRVRAVDAAGNPGPFSNVSSLVTEAAADTTPPSAPGTLASNAASSSEINLSWGPATDDVGVTGYRVERCAGAGCSSFVQVGTTAVTSFSDSGLAPSTSYSYRVRAVDAAGNPGAFSNTSSATTPDTSPPSAPGTLTSNAVSSSQINLSWGEATDDVGVAGYRVERCSGAGCANFVQIATPTGTSFGDTGLTASTSYSYRVRAVDAAGNAGALSNVSSATTSDTSAPSAPGTLTSNAVSSSQVNLSWGAATDDVGVTGYRVERCSGDGCASFVQIATPSGTSFNDTGLTASTSYSYRVRAVDAAGNPGPFSNISIATTPDTTPPSAPATLTSSAVSSTQIDLSWGAATDDVGVTGYRVERCSGAGCANFVQIATPTGTSFSDTGLTVATSYSYRVRAVDAAGNPGSFSNVSSATTPDTTPPSAPGALTSSALSDTQIDLSWIAATDDVGVTGYRVERCTGVGCANFAQIATPSGTTFSDTGLTASTSYRYRVHAVDAANNPGAFSNTSSATTLEPPDTAPPSAPGTLTSSAVSDTQINLSWGAATDNIGVTGYRVERCAGAGCSSFAQIATPAGTSFDDTGLAESTSYSYRVRAADAAGNLGAFSNTSFATTQAAPDTTPPGAPGTLTSSAVSSTQIDLSWGSATDNVGVTGYQVERCAGAGCGNFAQFATATGTGYSDTGLAPSTPYSYRVRAVDAAGNSGAFSNTSFVATQAAPDTAAPSAPGTVTSSAVSSTQINLSWGAATDDVGVTGYRVERCSGAGCTSFAQIATPIGTSFNDTGLSDSTSYSYRVRAEDAANNLGPFSNTTSATTPDTTLPSAPGALTASAVSATQIDLSWDAATDNVGVTGYRVERCSGAGCTSFAQIATPTGTSFNDTGLSASTSYSYRVRAQDAASNLSGFSNTAVTVTQQQPDTTAPGAPGTLTASAASSSQINLSWGSATDDVGVTGYRLERCAGSGCTNFAQIATPSGTSHSDTGRNAATSYTYRVRATDAAGNLGAFSNTASATTTAGTSNGTFQNEILITGMNLPTAVRFLPDGDMLILELGGKIWLVPAGTNEVNATPFLSLTNIGEGYQGLMDLTLDPDFESNHYYYVFYTLGSPNRDRVARFTVNDDYSGTIPGSEFVVYQDPLDASSEHHGGALNFGGDGKLYVTTGEQFNPPDSQDLTSSRGKILRINGDGSVPTDNPFYDGAGPNRDDVWALGLRNPFRAFYDGPSGRLYVADVGGNDYSTAQEEVHLGVAGANYGWPDCEGSSCAGDPTYTSPIYSYPHLGRDASITGGFIYRGTQFPAEYYGNYFFADYSQNWIKRLTFDAGGNVSGALAFEPADGSADGLYGDIVDLREGPDGALYYVDLGFSDTTGETGVSKIRRIRFISGDLPPVAVAAGTPTDSTTAPLTVNFSSAGSVDPEGEPLTYLWDFGDGATSTAANPTHVYSQLGAYSAHVTVSDGTVSTTSAPLQITVGNKPVPAITSPSDTSLFRGGDTIAITGTASDLEDGALPASAFSWTVDFLHAGHVHPGLPTTGTTTLVFPIPMSGHDFSGDTRYRITLTVTDSHGLKASRSVTIYPDKVNLMFDTVPSGLNIEIDGLPHTTPYVHDTVINFTHTINAPNQALGGNVQTFSSWSDGGAQQHTIVVPAVDRAYTATYTVSTPQFPLGLVAGYRLDEGAGSTTADISGNNATGTLVSAPTWTTGRYGSALQFNGASYVDLGNPVPLRLTGSMTLSAWINIGTNPSDDGTIVGKLGGAGWQLKTSPDTGPRTAAIQISSNGSDSIQRFSASVLTPGVWYYVAGVYDAAARTLQIYVNGVLDNGVLSGTVPAAQFDAPFNANIAQRTGSPGTFNFLGRIDEVHIFDRALSAAEIQTDMNLPR